MDLSKRRDDSDEGEITDQDTLDLLEAIEKGKDRMN